MHKALPCEEKSNVKQMEQPTKLDYLYFNDILLSACSNDNNNNQTSKN